jgi:hypothetical protein
LIFITPTFILSAHIRTTKESLSISTIFHQFNSELAQRFSLSVLTKLDNPTSRLKTLRSIASTAFFNFQEENRTKTCKRATFFLAKQSLLSIERIKIKNNGCAFKNMTLNWLIPLKKEVYNNRDSFPSLEHYTKLHTNTKSLLL